MSTTVKAAIGGVGTLRDKVALVRCGAVLLGFEARYVAQVGFPDLVQDFTMAEGRSLRGHVGHGRVGDQPCSVWDLGQLLGLGAQQRAVIALERPGGLVVFRCGEILAVEAIEESRRCPLPGGLSTAREGLFKAAVQRPDGAGGVEVAWVLRASSLLGRHELQRIQKDWQRTGMSV